MFYLSVSTAILSSFFSIKFSIAYLALGLPWHAVDTIAAIATAVVLEVAKYTLLSHGWRDSASCIRATRTMGRVAFGLGLAITCGSVAASMLWLGESRGAVQSREDAASQDTMAMKRVEAEAMQVREAQAREAARLETLIDAAATAYASDVATGYRTRAARLLHDVDRLREDKRGLHAAVEGVTTASMVRIAADSTIAGDSTGHKRSSTVITHGIIALLVELTAAVTAAMSKAIRRPIAASVAPMTAVAVAPSLPATGLEGVFEDLRTGAVAATTRAIGLRYRVGPKKACAWLREARVAGVVS